MTEMDWLGVAEGLCRRGGRYSDIANEAGPGELALANSVAALVLYGLANAILDGLVPKDEED